MNIDQITPDAKDLMRAEDIFKAKTWEIEGKASKMAKLITNKEKLIRRSKALAHLCGDDQNRIYLAFRHFETRLRQFGLSADQIHEIKQFRYNTPENVMSDWF